jgi:hypothetical protein
MLWDGGINSTRRGSRGGDRDPQPPPPKIVFSTNLWTIAKKFARNIQWTLFTLISDLKIIQQAVKLPRASRNNSISTQKDNNKATLPINVRRTCEKRNVIYATKTIKSTIISNNKPIKALCIQFLKTIKHDCAVKRLTLVTWSYPRHLGRPSCWLSFWSANINHNGVYNMYIYKFI